MRLSPCVLVQPDGWARGEREGYGEPCDVTSLSLSLSGRVRTSLSLSLCTGHVEASPILHDAVDATSDRLAPNDAHKRRYASLE